MCMGRLVFGLVWFVCVFVMFCSFMCCCGLCVCVLLCDFIVCCFWFRFYFPVLVLFCNLFILFLTLFHFILSSSFLVGVHYINTWNQSANTTWFKYNVTFSTDHKLPSIEYWCRLISIVYNHMTTYVKRLVLRILSTVFIFRCTGSLFIYIGNAI